MNQTNLSDLKVIISDEHVRQRISPRPGDTLYLHLSDLLLAMKAHATEEKLDILDYGAGSSPYQSLFPNAAYRRADFDIGSEQKLDFVLNHLLNVDAPNSSFDMVLSTQVLEHVRHPENYLKECLRLLRPGGKLILTTHGIFPDHPCPLDLHRWTADGLAALCQDVGFQVVDVCKLTANARALLFLYDLQGRQLYRRDPSWRAVLFALYHKFYCRFRSGAHRWADSFFPDLRMVSNKTSPPDLLYINILVHAVKPSLP